MLIRYGNKLIMNKILLIRCGLTELVGLGECMELWGEPNEPGIQHQVYIFMQCVDI